MGVVRVQERDSSRLREARKRLLRTRRRKMEGAFLEEGMACAKAGRGEDGNFVES